MTMRSPLELGRLAGCERESTAALVAHLAEFDARRLYEGEGFPSVFKYCTTVLKLSEDSAYNRIQAARAARRFPTIVDRLATGGLSVTTVRLLAPHLTPENFEGLLTAADGKGKHKIEHLLRDLVSSAGCISVLFASARRTVGSGFGAAGNDRKRTARHFDFPGRLRSDRCPRF